MDRRSLRGICFFTILFIMTLKSFNQGFTISGTKLLDAHGNEFIIRGINMPHLWFPIRAYNSLSVIKELNVNCTRIVWQTDNDPGQLNEVIKKTVDLKIIPMVELHNATGGTKKDELMEMVEYYLRPDVKEVIDRYEKYILVNIANEWGDHTVSAEFWRDCYKEAIIKMRDAGYKYTLVIDGNGWGQDLSPILKYGRDLIECDPQKNLLFSIHMYGSWNEPGKINEELNKANDLLLPLIVGEFGYNFNNGENNLRCKVDHVEILRKCNELKMGYMPWSWCGNDELNSWLDMSKDWKTLTWWGKEMFESEYGITKTSKAASVFE